MRVVNPYSFTIYSIKIDETRMAALAPNDDCQADLGSLYNPGLLNALSARA